jgi:GTP-binding protein
MYITQPSVRPPTFVLFLDRPGALHFSKERFLINKIRQRFGFAGTPIELKIKSKKKK